MRLSGWHIDRYGIFSDLQVESLSPNMNVIAGPNESGKTTLHEFIRTILFGFLRRRDKNPFYPGDAAGFGGRLFLTDEKGERFVVERYEGPKGGAVTVTMPDGSTGDAAELRQLLGHASIDLFRNIFAFGIDEMRDIEALGEEEIRTKIYSAGAGMGALPLAEVLRRIEKERDDLYREGKGRSANSIARGFKKVEEIRKQLAEIERHRDRYEELQKEVERFRRDVQNKTTMHREALRRIEHFRSLERAWEPWTQRRSAVESLNKLEAIDDFPPEGPERLKEILQRIDSLDEQAQKTERDMVALEKEARRIKVEDRIPEQGARIKRMAQEIGGYRSFSKDLPKRSQELIDKENELDRDLRRLGPDWDEDRVDNFDTSITVTESVRAHRDDLTQARGDIEEARRRLQDAQSGKSEAEVLLKEVEFSGGFGISLWPAAVGWILVPIAAIWGTVAHEWLLPAVTGGVGALLAALYLLMRWYLIRETRSENVEQKRKALQKAEQTLDSSHKSFEEIEAGEIKTRDRWRDWLEQTGLGPSLSPDGVMELIQEVKSTRVLLAGVKELRRRCRRIREEVETFKKSAKELLEACGKPDVHPDKLPATVEQLTTELEQNIRNVDRLEKIKEELARFESEKKALDDRLQRHRGELDDLLKLGGASDPEEFRRRAQVFEERKTLREEIRKQDTAIAKEGGTGKDLQSFEKELARSNPEEIRTRIQEAEESRASFEKELGEAREQLGEIKKELEILEAEDRGSRLRLDQEQLVSRIEADGERWAVLALAQAMILKTREKYERERQPEVIRSAQGFFSEITSGRYPRLHAPLGEHTIEPEEVTGRRKSFGRLSRGTQEQLYLCLRLGLIKDFCRRSEPLPIIVDDVMVNFDPDRSRAICRVLARIAQDHQVLVFTCHPETVGMIRKAVPTSLLLETDGKKFTMKSK